VKHKILTEVVLLFILFVAGCSLTTDESMQQDDTADLIDGNMPQILYLTVCPDEDVCPVSTALSNPAIHDFVDTYAQCKGCNTPDLLPEHGIGKCIEYEVSETVTGWQVVFWVSENCSFRYGSPAESRITVALDAAGQQIEDISPREEVLKDPLYCETDTDCRDLSGSGVPFVGCSNVFYAPLHWSGYSPGERCVCENHQCVAQ